jgi:hypothetical protein
LPGPLAALAFTVLPTVFVLGWFTVVRLTDTSMANIVSLRRMELIRGYYAAGADCRLVMQVKVGVVTASLAW